MIVKMTGMASAGCDDNQPSTESDIQNTWLLKFEENVNQICGNKYVFKPKRLNLFLLISRYSTELVFI
jgi:hypothetical protein